MVQAESLHKGQLLRIDLEKVKDRLPNKLIKQITSYPIGKLVGFKMVDGNSFGLVLELSNGMRGWFFENELFEIERESVGTDN